MPLIIDTREPKIFPLLLKQAGISVERKYLLSGDYVIGETGIERKTVSDFFSSLYKRRLYPQLFKLKNNYSKPKLVVIGEIPPKSRWMRIGRKVVPVMLSKEEMDRKEKLMINNWAIMDRSLGIDVLRFDTNKQFIMYLIALFLNTNKKERKFKPVAKKGESQFEVLSNIYSQIPGIGRKMSDKLAKEYTVEEIISCPFSKLKSIKLLGPKKIKKIKETLTTK